MIGPAGRADAGAFLSRLLRLDPTAVVRLKPARSKSAPSGPAPGGLEPDREGLQAARERAARETAGRERAARETAGRAELWAMLPFGVLAVRPLAVTIDTDVTVGARALLATLQDPAAPPPQRRDEAWRWPLPPSRGRVVETIPAAEIGRLAQAASTTLREAAEHGVGGRAVGERVLRDALLDHVPIVVTGSDGVRVEVSQRLVQAVVRMGFVPIPSADPFKSVTFGDNLVTVRLAVGWIGIDTSYGSTWYRPSSPMRLS